MREIPIVRAVCTVHYVNLDAVSNARRLSIVYNTSFDYRMCFFCSCQRDSWAGTALTSPTQASASQSTHSVPSFCTYCVSTPLYCMCVCCLLIVYARLLVKVCMRMLMRVRVRECTAVQDCRVYRADIQETSHPLLWPLSLISLLPPPLEPQLQSTPPQHLLQMSVPRPEQGSGLAAQCTLCWSTSVRQCAPPAVRPRC